MLVRSTSPTVRVLPAAGRVLVNRFSYGLTPSLTLDVRRAGGARAWFESQLSPVSVTDRAGRAIDGWYPRLKLSPSELWGRRTAGDFMGWEVMADLSRRTLMRRMFSRRQLLEVMTDFWSNLLHVPLGDDEAWVHRVGYDATIRRHALGRFDEMLVAAITHPSMGIYLDNAQSTKQAPNENLGRELLELHTVGLGARFTERDVRHSSRLLTGYRVDIGTTYRASYDPSVHHTGRIEVLGFSHPNRERDGRAATTAYLRYLARHPATARRLALRLCTRLVADRPPADLVEAVATTFRRSGTDIGATLRTLVDHPSFAAIGAAKVRTPGEDYVATVRALGVRAERPTADDAFANAAHWQANGMGQTPYAWPAPNGFPEVDAAWAGVGRVLASSRTHLMLAGGWWPDHQATYQPESSWLPPLPARFGVVVDHMSRLLLGRAASESLATAVSLRLGYALDSLVDERHLQRWRVIPMLHTMLDSPEHMTR